MPMVPEDEPPSPEKPRPTVTPKIVPKESLELVKQFNKAMTELKLKATSLFAGLKETVPAAVLTMNAAVRKFGDEGANNMEEVEKEALSLQGQLERVLAVVDKNPELLGNFEQVIEGLKGEIEGLTQKIIEESLKLPGEKTPPGLTPAQQELADSIAQAGQAIGRGLLQGIEQGKKGVELLADVGRKLFVTAGNKAIEQLTKQAGEAIAGMTKLSSELVGGIINTVIAAVGFILSTLDKAKDAVETFGDVAPEVQSSQLVRGIVAGPQNVAIAEVGENIATAFLPTNERLDAIIGLMQEGLIALGGGGGGVEVPSAGRTQTP